MSFNFFNNMASLGLSLFLRLIMLLIMNLNVRVDDGGYIVSVANLSDINDFLNYSIYINYDDDSYDVEMDNTSALTGLPSYLG